MRLSVTEDALTPFGGLVPWAAYTKHIGIAEKLTADCPVKRTSPNATPVYDILQSFMLTDEGIARMRSVCAGTRPFGSFLTWNRWWAMTRGGVF